MYQNAAIIAIFLFLYGAVAGRVERSWISGPMVAVGVGLLLGPDGLDALRLRVTTEGLRTLAELTLAMVLFTDAANADLGTVRHTITLPSRLLLVGLPLTIVLGFVVAWLLFPELDVLEMALLAAMLAPTDAALGLPVVTSPAVPAPVREALNLESGLNDGICVPIVLILLGLATGTQIGTDSPGHAATVIIEEIGIGLVAGLVLTAGGTWALRRAHQHGWLSEHWLATPAVALAGGCFAAAQALGGSGFIACFVGGLLAGRLERGGAKHDLLRGTESVGAVLALLTWLVFGATVVGRVIPLLSWSVLAYAVLSLTAVRMLPVFICLAGAGMSASDKLLVGWFGPRGLASIVFGIIALQEQLPGTRTLAAVVVCTVLLSVVAHGATANPLLTAFRRPNRLDVAQPERF